MGDAAVRSVYKNSLALSHFRDCEVAVKMLPSFADDIARSDFNQVGTGDPAIGNLLT